MTTFLHPCLYAFTGMHFNWFPVPLGRPLSCWKQCRKPVIWWSISVLLGIYCTSYLHISFFFIVKVILKLSLNFIFFQSREDEIAESLSLLISGDWIISSCENLVRLTLLSPYENVSVERAITWNGKEVKIFIHNKELPRDNYVWDAASGMDPENVEEVSNCLARLAYLLQNSTICTGLETVC